MLRSMLGCVQANQWLVAKSGGLEVIACAMRGWRDYPMVQLCALLCMVPLALDNTVLQVRVAAVVRAMIWERSDHIKIAKLSIGPSMEWSVTMLSPSLLVKGAIAPSKQE